MVGSIMEARVINMLLMGKKADTRKVFESDDRDTCRIY